MTDNYFADQTFKQIDFTQVKLVKGVYDNCSFVNCNFQAMHASNIEFITCSFIDCNFSNTIVANTAFKEVAFSNCKLVGIKFKDCNPFLLQFSFTDCQLKYASFYQLKIPKTVFKNCNLEEADFTESTITGAVFANCNLRNAVFMATNLEKADLSTALNFIINPQKNKIKGAQFSKHNVMGLLHHFKVIIA